MNNSDPFKLLLDMEHRCLSGSAGMPVSEEVDEEWVGVGFRIGDDRLIAAMSEVEEILELPDFTKVPGVKSWVVGVANVRGNLLPLMDLKKFLIGEEVRQKRKGKVIVIKYKGFNTGLIVEEVYGMKHFLKKDELSKLPAVHAKIEPYINKAYSLDDDDWPVFDFGHMADNDDFASAAL